MDYANPPVTEIWASFPYREDVAAKRAIGWETLREVYETCWADDFPRKSFGSVREVTLESQRGDDFGRARFGPTEFDSLKIGDESQTKWIKIDRAAIQYSLVRTDDHVPLYSELKRGALATLEKFLGFFAPMSVDACTLHYVDVLQLPVHDGELNLDDFLRIQWNLPDGFGRAAKFLLHFGFVPRDNAYFQVRAAVTETTDEFVRLRLDWDYQSQRLGGQDEIEAKLDEAHKHIGRCFEASLTDASRALFNQ